jgi:predicted nucleic acid-binding protein
MRLYLDVCCLNRPFDNQEIDRNRLEAEAVVAIVARIRKGRHSLITSEVVYREVDAGEDAEKAELVRQIVRLATDHVVVAADTLERWQELMDMGFRQLDAMHLACAESAPCDLFLTTDDKLLKRARANTSRLRIKVMNPLAYVTEVEP